MHFTTMLRPFGRLTAAAATVLALGAGLASMGVYLLMALVLLAKPRGLFPTHA